MFSYRLILKQAWNIAWNHKYLWILGLFASIAAASGSFEYQLLNTSFQRSALENSSYHINTILLVGQTIVGFFVGLVSLFSYDIVTIINTLTVIIITLTLIGAFVWLSISSQGALVVSVKKLLAPKKRDAVIRIKDNLVIGHQHFWSVLGLNVLIKLMIGLALFIMSVPLLFLSIKGSTYLAFIYTLEFVIFTPIAIMLALIIKYAIAYRVLDNESFSNSLRKSFSLFANNWLISIEMGIILFIISFLVGLGILLIISIFIFPYLIFAGSYGLSWLLVLLMLIALVITLYIGSLLTTFQISAWTSLFLELKEGRGVAKLERAFKRK